MGSSYEFLYRTLEEMHEPEEARLSSPLPDFALGSLIRTGPGKFDFENFTVNHFLDGYAMLTRFQISKNAVKYDRKFLMTDAYKKAVIANCPVLSEYGTRGQKSDPTKSILSRFIPSLVPEITDNCNVSIFNIGKDVFAAADSCFFRQIDPLTLECSEKYDTSKLFGLNLWSCHPMPDKDGFIYNIGTSFITGLKYNIIKIPKPAGSSHPPKETFKKATVLASIPSSHLFCSSPIHSFGMTPNYIVFIEQPLVIVAQKVLAAFLHKSSNREFMEYRPEFKNRFHIIDKRTGKAVVKTEYISSEPFFFLHIINCYEHGEMELVVDLCAFPNANCIDISLQDFKNGFEGGLEDLAEGRRYVIPLDINDKNGNEILEGSNLVKHVKTAATAVKDKRSIILTYETLTQQGIEVPVVHKMFRGQRYKHFFGGGPRAVGPYRSAICKFNVDSKECRPFRLKEGEFLGEPAFIENPNGTEDDDGILVSCLTNAVEGGKCGIVFVAAKTMTLMSRADFNNFVPLSIHGMFIPEEDDN